MKEELVKKVKQAITLLQSASKTAAKHGQPLEICYSGGKDSEVILELAKMAGIEFRAIYKNTTIDPPGTIKHAREKGVEVMQPVMNFQQIIAQTGMPNRWRRFCCKLLKEYKVLDYAVVGVRREESRARKKLYHEPEMCRVYRKGVEARQYLPILEWSSKDVAEFLTARGVQCHPLYYDEQGNFHAERRLGCMCCPLMSRKKRIDSFREHPKMIRFYLKGAQQYLDNHPNSKIGKLYNNNSFGWLTSQIFFNSAQQFRECCGPNLFDDGFDCKKFLEEYFKVCLDGL